MRALCLLMLGLILHGQPALNGPLAGRGLDVHPARPAGQDPEAVARQRAMAWLHTQQLPDGSFGMRTANGSYQGSPAATADAVYVLATLGEDPAGPAWTAQEGGRSASALDALARLAPDYAGADPGQAGKVARAVIAAGRDPRSFAGLDLLGVIERAYMPASGRYQADLLYRDALAIAALGRAGVPVPAAAIAALWQARRPNGGWAWSFSGEAPDVDTTGWVLQVLATYGGMHCAPALLGSAEYLASQQADEGGWGTGSPPGPVNADSTALAVAGLRAAGFDLDQPHWSRNGRPPVASLLALQEPSGAFVYINQSGREEVRLAATLDALAALLPATTGQPVCSPIYLPVLTVG